MRFPCDRSISSDERIVPGIPPTYAGDALDDVGGHRYAFGPRQPLDLAAAVEKPCADERIGPESGRSAAGMRR